MLRAFSTSIGRGVHRGIGRILLAWLASSIATGLMVGQALAAAQLDGGTEGRVDAGEAGDDRGEVGGSGRGSADAVGADAQAAPALEEDRPAFLRVVINQIDIGDALVILRGPDVLMRVQDLEKSGMHVPDTRLARRADEARVSLGSLAPKLTFVFNEVDLTLTITADGGLFETTTVDLKAKRPPGIVYASAPTLFVNYQAQALDLQTRRDTRLGAFVESGASYRGLLLYGSANYAGQSASDSYGHLFHDATWMRQMTNLTYDWREHLTRLVAGDVLVGAGDVLGGGGILGGASVSRSFALDPYFTFLPAMNLSGTALTPSTVEVYVNGQLVKREVLPPGQFNLQNVPLTNGSGETRVVVRDAFGGQQTMVNPYYLALGTLARGLSDFSYSLGAVRSNPGAESWSYGQPAFAFRHRRGLTDWLTVGARAEGTRDVLSGGASLAARVSFARYTLGELGLSLGASGESGQAGLAALGSYAYVGSPFLLQIGLRYFTDHYANLSLPAAADRQRLDVLGNVAMNVGTVASVALQLEHAAMRDAGRTDNAALRLNRSVLRWMYLFAELGTTWSSIQRTEYHTFIGLTFALSDRTTTAVSRADGWTAEGNHGGTGQATVQRSLPVGSGLGYRLAVAEGSSDINDAVAQYQGSYGRIEAEYRHDGWNANRGETTLTATGGVVLIGGRAYLTRPVQDAFALIRVPGVEGVHGLASNQVVGTTDAKGDLLIPNLLSYYGNRISIDDKDIPLDHDIAKTELSIAPPYRGGAIVGFPVRQVLAAAGTVVIEENGRTLAPAYGQLVIEVAGRAVVSPFDADGNFYLEDVAPGVYPAEAQYATGACTFRLQIAPRATALVQLGTVRCIVGKVPTTETKESE